MDLKKNIKFCNVKQSRSYLPLTLRSLLWEKRGTLDYNLGVTEESVSTWTDPPNLRGNEKG